MQDQSWQAVVEAEKEQLINTILNNLITHSGECFLFSNKGLVKVTDKEIFKKNLTKLTLDKLKDIQIDTSGPKVLKCYRFLKAFVNTPSIREQVKSVIQYALDLIESTLNNHANDISKITSHHIDLIFNIFSFLNNSVSNILSVVDFCQKHLDVTIPERGDNQNFEKLSNLETLKDLNDTELDAILSNLQSFQFEPMSEIDIGDKLFAMTFEQLLNLIAEIKNQHSIHSELSVFFAPLIHKVLIKRAKASRFKHDALADIDANSNPLVYLSSLSSAIQKLDLQLQKEQSIIPCLIGKISPECFQGNLDETSLISTINAKYQSKLKANQLRWDSDKKCYMVKCISKGFISDTVTEMPFKAYVDQQAFKLSEQVIGKLKLQRQIIQAKSSYLDYVRHEFESKYRQYLNKLVLELDLCPDQTDEKDVASLIDALITSDPTTIQMLIAQGDFSKWQAFLQNDEFQSLYPKLLEEFSNYVTGRGFHESADIVRVYEQIRFLEEIKTAFPNYLSQQEVHDLARLRYYPDYYILRSVIWDKLTNASDKRLNFLVLIPEYRELYKEFRIDSDYSEAPLLSPHVKQSLLSLDAVYQSAIKELQATYKSYGLPLADQNLLDTAPTLWQKAQQIKVLPEVADITISFTDFADFESWDSVFDQIKAKVEILKAKIAKFGDGANKETSEILSIEKYSEIVWKHGEFFLKNPDRFSFDKNLKEYLIALQTIDKHCSTYEQMLKERQAYQVQKLKTECQALLNQLSAHTIGKNYLYLIQEKENQLSSLRDFALLTKEKETLEKLVKEHVTIQELLTEYENLLEQYKKLGFHGEDDPLLVLPVLNENNEKIESFSDYMSAVTTYRSSIKDCQVALGDGVVLMKEKMERISTKKAHQEPGLPKKLSGPADDSEKPNFTVPIGEEEGKLANYPVLEKQQSVAMAEAERKRVAQVQQTQWLAEQKEKLAKIQKKVTTLESYFEKLTLDIPAPVMSDLVQNDIENRSLAQDIQQNELRKSLYEAELTQKRKQLLNKIQIYLNDEKGCPKGLRSIQAKRDELYEIINNDHDFIQDLKSDTQKKALEELKTNLSAIMQALNNHKQLLEAEGYDWIESANRFSQTFAKIPQIASVQKEALKNVTTYITMHHQAKATYEAELQPIQAEATKLIAQLKHADIPKESTDLKAIMKKLASIAQVSVQKDKFKTIDEVKQTLAEIQASVKQILQQQVTIAQATGGVKLDFLIKEDVASKVQVLTVLRTVQTTHHALSENTQKIAQLAKVEILLSPNAKGQSSVEPQLQTAITVSSIDDLVLHQAMLERQAEQKKSELASREKQIREKVASQMTATRAIMTQQKQFYQKQKQTLKAVYERTLTIKGKFANDKDVLNLNQSIIQQGQAIQQALTTLEQHDTALNNLSQKSLTEIVADDITALSKPTVSKVTDEVEQIGQRAERVVQDYTKAKQEFIVALKSAVEIVINAVQGAEKDDLVKSFLQKITAVQANAESVFDEGKTFETIKKELNQHYKKLKEKLVTQQAELIQQLQTLDKNVQYTALARSATVSALVNNNQALKEKIKIVKETQAINDIKTKITVIDANLALLGISFDKVSENNTDLLVVQQALKDRRQAFVSYKKNLTANIEKRLIFLDDAISNYESMREALSKLSAVPDLLNSRQIKDLEKLKTSIADNNQAYEQEKESLKLVKRNMDEFNINIPAVTGVIATASSLEKIDNKAEEEKGKKAISEFDKLMLPYLTHRINYYSSEGILKDIVDIAEKINLYDLKLDVETNKILTELNLLSKRLSKGNLIEAREQYEKLQKSLIINLNIEISRITGKTENHTSLSLCFAQYAEVSSSRNQLVTSIQWNVDQANFSFRKIAHKLSYFFNPLSTRTLVELAEIKEIYPDYQIAKPEKTLIEQHPSPKVTAQPVRPVIPTISLKPIQGKEILSQQILYLDNMEKNIQAEIDKVEFELSSKKFVETKEKDDAKKYFEQLMAKMQRQKIMLAFVVQVITIINEKKADFRRLEKPLEKINYLNAISYLNFFPDKSASNLCNPELVLNWLLAQANNANITFTDIEKTEILTIIAELKATDNQNYLTKLKGFYETRQRFGDKFLKLMQDNSKSLVEKHGKLNEMNIKQYQDQNPRKWVSFVKNPSVRCISEQLRREKEALYVPENIGSVKA